MNERIRELAKQAGMWRQHYDLGEESPSNLEEFAELLIEECADIATNRYQRLMDGGKAIKQHFGVE